MDISPDQAQKLAQRYNLSTEAILGFHGELREVWHKSHNYKPWEYSLAAREHIGAGDHRKATTFWLVENARRDRIGYSESLNRFIALSVPRQ